MIRHCTLDATDIAWIARHRRAHNRLGFAVQLCCLRHPGRLLERGEMPPAAMLQALADQIGAAPGDFAAYGRRDKTRHRHATEIMVALGLSKVTAGRRRARRDWLLARALEIGDAASLAEAWLADCRARRLVVPPQRRMAADCRQAMTNARKEIWRRLAGDLSRKEADALEALLQQRPGERTSVLAWLRRAPQAARAGQMREVFDRLEHVRAVGIDRRRRNLAPRARFDALVEEARRVSVQHLRDQKKLRRRATLVAAVIDLEIALIDHGVDLVGRFLVNLFNRTEQAHAEGVQSKGKVISGQLKSHVDLVEVLAEAKETGVDALALVEDRLGWELTIESAALSRNLVAGDAFNPLSELPEKYPSFKRIAVPFLKTHAFKGAAGASALLRAIGMIRKAWEDGATDLPEGLPTSFVSRRWTRFVFADDGGLDRRYYEFCAFDALFNRLRAGDVWIEGAGRYAPFEEGLIAPEVWGRLCEEGRHNLAVETDFGAFFARVQAEMHERLAKIERLAASNTLPNAAIDTSGLRIGRPEGLQEARDAEPFARRLYAAMPSVRITELLTEVDRWTGFAEAFTHLRTGHPAVQRQALLSAVLADGTNMSLTRMAEASQGFSVRQLARNTHLDRRLACAGGNLWPGARADRGYATRSTARGQVWRSRDCEFRWPAFSRRRSCRGAQRGQRQIRTRAGRRFLYAYLRPVRSIPFGANPGQRGRGALCAWRPAGP